METKEKLNHLRHSAAHLLAAAVLRLWPNTKLTIGPAIENGFYYDFDFENPVTEADLPKIEKKMADTVQEWTEFTHREITPEEAREIYKDNPYKLELIDEIVEKGEPITLYKSGRFEDLCRGGHSENPREEIGAFKLLSLAGAYWRGSEKNKMLTRIYGTAFPTQEELDKHLEMLEEAKKRDHKRLGRELELFTFDETAPGMAYWLPKGQIVYKTLLRFVQDKYEEFGYQEVATPILNKKQLYETSGHWSHYKDDMFISDMSREARSHKAEQSDTKENESEVFGVKPMNCPNAMKMFTFKTYSYNDLPLRLAETSSLHRFELSGTLNGLFRIRHFHQDDAHVFIGKENIEDEFKNLMDMIEKMYKPFGLSYKLRFGTRPEKALGDKSDWDLTEKILRVALKGSGKEYFEIEGEGAFYGPKVDILMTDSLGREWQTGTVQLDIQQPKRFDLAYTEKDGSRVMPFVYHRAILGSFERFLGILTEHYAGKFPLWLAPVQVIILPIADRHLEAANKIKNSIRKKGIRAEVSGKSQTLQARIREATLQKIAYMGIIGDREIEKNGVSLRDREGKDHGFIDLDKLSDKLLEEIDKKI